MSFNSGQLIIIEDGTPVDRTQQIHDDSPFNWSNTRGRRGTASVPLMLLADEVYLPSIGWPVYIFEVYQSPPSTERIFAGVVSEFDFEYFNDQGDRVCTLTVVSLEKYFDTVQTPEADYTGQTAGAIFTAIFNAVIGSVPSTPAITLGTVEAGVTISERTYNGTSNAASDFQQLATDSGLIWYVDPRDFKVYFHAHDSRAASFTVVSDDVYTEAAKSSIKWHISDSDFRDRTLIQTSPNVVPPLQASFVGDGATLDFTLPNIPSKITGAYITTATAPTSTATFTGQPSDGDTATVHPSDRAPTYIYTFVDALDNTIGFQVLIGATAADTAQNFADCINGVPAQAGVTYSTPSHANGEIQAGELTGSTFDVRALAVGPATITLTDAASNFAWSDSPLANGATSGIVSLSVGVLGSGAFDLVYTPGTAAISVLVAIPDAVTLTVQYIAAASGQLTVASGAATSLGVPSQFRMFTSRGAPTVEAALQQANAQLAAYSVLPKVFEFTSDKPGLFCGGYVAVLLTVPADAAAVLNGNWLVQEVRGNWIAGFELNEPPFACHFRYTYTLINTTEIATYQDTLSRIADTGPFEQPQPIDPPSPSTSPSGSGVPDPGAGGSGNLRAGQDWVQETLGLAILESGDDLVAGGGDGKTLSSASHTFVSGEIGQSIEIVTATGWTPGAYEILSISAGAAVVGTAPAADGTTGGLWGTAAATTYQFTWAPALSYWTGNHQAFVNLGTPNNDSPLTFEYRQLNPFAYAQRGYVISPIDGNNGPDYTITGDQLTLRDPIAEDQILLVHYYPDSPTKLPHRKAGDPPAHTPLFVVAKDDGDSTGKIIMTSPNGADWTERTTPLSSGGNAVAFGNGVYVVGTFLASGTNQIATSTDAIAWTGRSSPANSSAVQAMIFANGKFVAIYGTGTRNIMTSTNGVDWTSHSVPSPSATWTALAYSPDLDLWLAVAHSGETMTSPDAETWTDTGGGVFDADCCAWGAGTFVVLGGSNGSGVHLYTSADGDSFSSQADPDGWDFPWFAVVFAQSHFTAVGQTPIDGDTRTGTSADGIDWDTVIPPVNKTWQGLAFGGGKYVACANNNADTDMIMTATDGTDWTTQTTPSVANCVAVCYG